MNFQDIIKKSVINTDAFAAQPVDRVIAILIWAAVAGVILFFIYRAFSRNVVYEHSFATALAVMTVLTAMIILTITSNIVLSLGMVGALSIVRYRTAVKSSFDLVFMFWSVALGIMIGAGFFVYAVVGSIVAFLLLMLLNFLKPIDKAYMLIIHYTKNVQDTVLAILNRVTYEIKAKNVTNENIELTIKIAARKFDMGIVNKLSETTGVSDAILVQYSSDEV